MLVVWRGGWVRLALRPVRQLLIFGDKEARGRVAAVQRMWRVVQTVHRGRSLRTALRLAGTGRAAELARGLALPGGGAGGSWRGEAP